MNINHLHEAVANMMTKTQAMIVIIPPRANLEAVGTTKNMTAHIPTVADVRVGRAAGSGILKGIPKHHAVDGTNVARHKVVSRGLPLETVFLERK